MQRTYSSSNHHIAVYEPCVQTRAYDCTLMGLVGTGCHRKYWGISGKMSSQTQRFGASCLCVLTQREPEFKLMFFQTHQN